MGPRAGSSPIAAALVGLHQPRALGYDAGADILYILDDRHLDDMIAYMESL